MNIYITIMFLFFCLSTYGQENKLIDNSELNSHTLTLEDIPDWILEHIKFPEEAYQYGMAGVEHLSISTSWDGKVFISSKLNTLNPAFEKEIMEVVNKAPRCGYAGIRPENINKPMLIDFYQYIPENRRGSIQRVSLHMPPLFEYPIGGRVAFVKKIYDKLQVPKQLRNGYSDTITLQYVVAEDRKVEKFFITDCRSNELKEELLRVLKKTSKWDIAAQIEGNKQVAVTLCDRMIVDINNKGKKMPFKEYVDEVFCNTKTAPKDSTIIILNPEVKPKFLGKTSFRKDIVQALDVEKRTKVAGAFIVETNGMIDYVKLSKTDNAKLDSLLTINIKKTRWLAGMQGKTPVRTYMFFELSVRPSFVKKKHYHSNESLYEIHGKYYLALIANPNGFYCGYTDGLGGRHRYPYRVRATFDYNAYYQSLNEYYKQSRLNAKNASKKYFKTIERLFVK